MLIRFSLAALFAVLVAASRPHASGGDHDLLAVGVRWEEEVGGRRVTRLSVAAPTRAALEAHRAILRTSAREALLQGSGVFASTPAGAGGGRHVLEMVYYGVRSRAGRSPVAFGDPAEGVPAAFAAAHGAALDIAALPPTVSEAGARLLLATDDDLAFRDALDALIEARADAASAAALTAIRSAGPGSASPSRRLLAVQALKRLGGAAAYPEDFRRLRQSDDPDIRAAASQ